MPNRKELRNVYIYDPKTGDKTLTRMCKLKPDDIFCLEDSDGKKVEPTDDRMCWICTEHPYITDHKLESGVPVYGVVAAPYPLREEEDDQDN